MDGYGPRAAPLPDMYYRSHQHEELKAMTDAGEPVVSEEIADRWSAMGGGLEQAGILLQQAVFGSESGWSGQAGDAMRYRLGQVAEWSYNSGQSFTEASSAVREQSSAVGEAKNRMPEPVPYDPDQIIDQAMAGGLPGIVALPQRMYEQRQKHEAAYEEAVHVVNARDLLLVQGAGTIPQFSPPPALSNDTGGSGDDGGRRSTGEGGGSGVERGYVGGPEGASGAFGPSGSGSGSGEAAGGAGSFGSGPGTAGPGPSGPGPQVTTPGYTPKPPVARPPEVSVGRPPGAGPGSPGDAPGLGPGVGFIPGPGLGLGGGPGSGGGSGGGSGAGPARGFGSGAGAPGGGGGPGAGGGPGRVPGGAAGMGPGGSAAAEAAGAGRGAAGARGGAGMAGMPMGAARGQGDADTEHQRAGYLQEDDPEGLFGTDEKTAPPVLGLE